MEQKQPDINVIQSVNLADLRAARQASKRGLFANIRWLLLSTEGRLNRIGYWLSGIFIQAPVVYVFMRRLMTLGETQGVAALTTLLCMCVILGPVLAAAQVKRLHDLSLRGWWALLPVIILIAGMGMKSLLLYGLCGFCLLLLGFVAGDKRANDHGAPYSGLFP